MYDLHAVHVPEQHTDVETHPTQAPLVHVSHALVRQHEDAPQHTYPVAQRPFV